MNTTTRYISVVDTAKLLRKNLKAAFPGVKFSVRSSRYAGGASIDVRWTDGPTEAEVKPTLSLFAGATFDGMTDMKTHHSSILVDEDGVPETVHFGANYVFGSRDVSPEWVAEIADTYLDLDTVGRAGDEGICEHCRLSGKDGHVYFTLPTRGHIRLCAEHAADRIARLTPREVLA